MRRLVMVVGTTILLLGAFAANAFAAKDFAKISLNILPSGQFGVPGPPADDQALMYDALTPLFDHVTASDLNQDFKSEALGIGTDGPTTEEDVPFQGVTLLRDSFHVPHVYSKTYKGGILAAGWIAAEDRGLLLQTARNNARVAVLDAPGLSAIGLTASVQNFQPSAQTEAVVAKQTKALKGAGKEGRAVLSDIDTFVKGINAYLDASSSPNPHWTRNDVYAVNALKDQFLGEGGGDEARRSQFLGGLQDRLGAKKGFKVFNDLRQFKNPESPTTVDGNFPYGHIPKRHPGSVVLDHGSFTPTPAARVAQSKASAAVSQPFNASNELMVDGEHSTTGHPILVGGPQISYFFPGLVYEIDMHAPHLNWRGATTAPFPGYLLIGRGSDFSTTLTSASGDVIDQFAETLCGDSEEMYLYRGKCRSMGHFHAGTLNGNPVDYLTTVHGPVVGYATVDGREVAISSKRSSRNKDVLDLLYNRRLSDGQVHSPKTFFKAASLTPQTFNSFYVDDKHIADFTSGRLPLRDPRTDPGLLTKGTGQYEWRGFLSAKDHIHGTDNKRGTMTNWNNSAAHGFGAADNEWGRNGSVARVDLLNRNLKLLEKNGKWSPASVTSAMNAAATQDVRAIDTVPLLVKLLKGTTAPSPQAQQMLNLLVAWRNHGGSRLDGDLDGEIDDPGAAIMDAAFPRIASNVMGPILDTQLDELNSLFRRFDKPPSGQYSGWHMYMDKDIRTLLGMPVKQPYNVAYCGKGKLAACQATVWAAIQAAGNVLTTDQGTANPADWRANATAERINFNPLPLIQMRYTNRPSGIQQVISFDGHR